MRSFVALWMTVRDIASFGQGNGTVTRAFSLLVKAWGNRVGALIRML